MLLFFSFVICISITLPTNLQAAHAAESADSKSPGSQVQSRETILTPEEPLLYSKKILYGIIGTVGLIMLIASVTLAWNRRLRKEIKKREKAEAALRESEEQFRNLVETSQDLIWKCDSEGRFTYLNSAWETVVGYKVDEMLNRHFTEFKPPEIVRRDAETFKKILKGSDTFGYETIYISRSGEEKYLVFNARFLKDDDGNVIGTQGTAHDITDDRRAAEALNDSERKFHGLFDLSRDVIAMVSLEGEILDANNAYLNMLGYNLKEIRAITYQQITPLKWHSMESEIVNEQIIKRGYSDLYEKEYIRKDGTVFPVSVRAVLIKDENGESVGMWGIVRDITQRKEAEEEVRKLFRAVEQSPASVIITDTGGNIEYVNPKFMQTTGYSFDEVIGGNPRILKSGEQPPEFYDELWKTITAGKEWRGEFHNKKKNGELYWEYASISPVKDDEGNTTHFVAVKEDITNRKKTEAKIQEAHQRVLTIMDSIDALIYVADMDNYELLFVNKYGRDVWGDIIGKSCWSELQEGQTGPCEFCTNKYLLDREGRPKGVYTWEFQNTVNKHWYYIQDKAIRWIDGRIVRLEVASDITDRKR
ncbi:MAG: PAS domain S-box protein, partial [Thermodesulfovibrionia bacterium]|nr:PAS domain S-box protein [Thermodesulfovibrionia bacterium]